MIKRKIRKMLSALRHPGTNETYAKYGYDLFRADVFALSYDIAYGPRPDRHLAAALRKAIGGPAPIIDRAIPSSYFVMPDQYPALIAVLEMAERHNP